MKLSIIIPCHNNESTILKTIRSIYSSNNINKHKFEIIVIDDFSLDGSYNLVKRNFPTVKIHRLKKHSGAAKARNIGIKKSKGSLLLFIDADAWFNKATIHDLMTGIDKNTDIAFPKLNYENGHLLYPVFEEEKKYPYISGCFLIKKKSLKKLDEYFDEFYKTYLEDYDFFIRCKLANLKAKYIENARVIHADKEQKDYSERYYLEVRNLMYGKIKLGSKKPFTFTNLIKAFFLGILNFAWFNWQGYDRESTLKLKLNVIKNKKNKIFSKNSLKAVTLYLKAVHEIMKNLNKVQKKRVIVRKFYNLKK